MTITLVERLRVYVEDDRYSDEAVGMALRQVWPALAAALLAEREAAAKVAEDWAGSCDVCGCDQARKIAEAIRETAQ
jgi:hypothetical protein